MSHRKNPGNTKYVLDGHWLMEIDGVGKNKPQAMGPPQISDTPFQGYVIDVC